MQYLLIKTEKNMKKILLLILAVSFVLPSFSQEVSTEKNVLKVNTLALFLGTGSIFYERQLSDGMSGQLGVGYLNYGISDNSFSGLFLTPEVRFYIRQNAIDGMYIGPYLRYQNYTVKTDNAGKGSLSVMGGGVALGRQWITNSGFTMDLFFGGHYGAANLTAEDENGTEADFDYDTFKGFKVRLGFALGFAF